MKKIILLFSMVFIIISYCNNVFSFDLNGCWKNEDGNANKNNKVMCFSKNMLKTINLETEVLYKYNNEHVLIEIPSTKAKLRVSNDGDNIIYLYSPVLFEKIKYIRISPEEADKLLKKDQSGK